MPSVIAVKCPYHLWLLIFVIRIACWAYLDTLIWCSGDLCAERCVWEVSKAAQQNAKDSNIISFAAVLNNSLDRDAARCHSSLRLAQALGTATGTIAFCPGYSYFVLMANASDPVIRKWLAPGSCWICIYFILFFPPSPWMETVLPLR